MFKLITLLGLMGSTIVLAQVNVTLIDPISRYDYLGNLSVPNSTYPPDWPASWQSVLQSEFEIPPDCGEDTYVGTGKLQGLRALITGGDSGIGRAIVIAYLREGAQVAINYLPDEESDAEDLADFVAQEGYTIERIPGDLMNETFCAELVHEAARRMGGLEILIGNHGWAPTQFGPLLRPVSNHSTVQLDRVFRTNVYSNIFLTRAAVPYMPPGGSILFTTSGMADNPQYSVIDYGASKAAISHLTSSLARQLVNRGIRVNAVQPALTYTPFLAMMGFNAAILAEAANRNFYGRLEQPAELAPLYVQLADPIGTYTTGNIYTASGAMTFK